jgi:hypothetical protein
MHDCRGQGYDNGANMVGLEQGVQSRITRDFRRSFFNPRGCHSLNLVVSYAAKTSVKSVSLFGVIQRLFVFFSSSTKRWEDISGAGLAQEILTLRNFLGADQGQPKDVLNVLKKNDWQDLFPNTWTVLRILQTIPVTAAKGDGSFSTLKLIKTYLRSTIAQEKMSNLAILSIENDIAQSIPKID